MNAMIAKAGLEPGPFVQRDRAAHEHDVQRDEDGALDERDGGQAAEMRRRELMADHQAWQRCGEGRDRIGCSVEERPEHRSPCTYLRDHEGNRADQDAVLPAEKNLGCDDEDERERHEPAVLLVERDRLQLGEECEGEEDCDADDDCRPGRVQHNSGHGPGRNRDRRRNEGDGVPEKPGRVAAEQSSRAARAHQRPGRTSAVDCPARAGAARDEQRAERTENEQEPRETRIPLDHRCHLLQRPQSDANTLEILPLGCPGLPLKG